MCYELHVYRMQWLSSALLDLKWNDSTIFSRFLKLTTINRPILKKSNLHEENMGRLNFGIGCCVLGPHLRHLTI